MIALHALDYASGYQGETSYLLPHSYPKKSPSKRYASEAEYWETYYNDSDVIYEWNNGELQEKHMSDYLTISMYQCFFKLLEHYLETHPIAKTTMLEMGFRLVLPTKTVIRKPDLGLVLHTNPIALKALDQSYKGTFDLCVEGLSDSSEEDIKRDVVDKKLEYVAVGVKEYYILYGHGHLMEFYRFNANGIYTPIPRINDDVIQSQILPDFQFRISDLFKKPLPEEMIEDLIYRNFVLPGYSSAKEEAKTEKLARQQAKKEAKTEKLARQQAEKRALMAEKQALKKEAEIVRLQQLLTAKGNS